MTDWVHTLPLGTAALTMAIFFVGFTWFGSLFLAPILRVFVRSRTGTNDIVGNILASFGVFYGILLGLTAVAAYQNWSDVELSVSREANALLSIHTDIAGFPAPVREAIDASLLEVVERTMNEEWDLLREGQMQVGTADAIAALRTRLATFEAQTGTQALLHELALGHFNEFTEHRRFRLFSVNDGIPAVFWYVVIMGAIFNIVLIWLLDMKLVTQFFLGGMLSFYLGAIILLIARLDQPFRSKGGITADAFQAVYRVISAS